MTVSSAKTDEAKKILPPLLSMIDGDVQKAIYYLPKAATLALMVGDTILAHRIVSYQASLEEISKGLTEK